MTVPFANPEYDALLEGMADLGPGLAPEPPESQTNALVAPNPPEPSLLPEHADAMLLKALYGADCPLADLADGREVTEDQWVAWASSLWAERRASIQTHLWLTERNRMYRSGMQWVSSTGVGIPWKEPARPKEASRIVYNLIDKALDQRLQILTDQRPGFSINPMTQDPDDKRKAEARQLALDYQYDQQRMDRILREAGFWAQTDGVCFLHVFWDPDKGPWDERMGEGGSKKPLGDLNTQVLRVEQVRVSPNATATIPPYYVIVREVIPSAEAAHRYGLSGAVAADSGNTTSIATPQGMGSGDGLSTWVMQQTTIGEGDRLRTTDTVERFTVYLAPQPDVLPQGFQMVVVGNSVVYGPTELLFGMLPVLPWRDGSTDPSYYPRPIMEQWLDHQTRINALLSSWYDSIRVNKGGRFIARPGSVVKETFIGGMTSVIEASGAGTPEQALVPVPSFSIGSDVKEALALEKKAFEDASGYNDTSRGQVAADTSGRAILAAREQLERVFAPGVQAASHALTDWARITLAGMRWGYDVPRDLGAVGKGRPDLARALSAEDFDGAADVKVEPETLMPLPKAMRMFLLDNMLERQLMDPKEYRRRMPFGVIRDLSTPDEDQEARAERVADALLTRQQMVPPMRWQDNEAIHQDVLERRILLQDDIDPDIIQAADQRWKQLAQQAAVKQGGMAGRPQPGRPPGAAPRANGGGSPFAPTPGTQPLAQHLPAVAANPTMGSDGNAAATVFEAMSPQ